jgi:hypothetical protein
LPYSWRGWDCARIPRIQAPNPSGQAAGDKQAPGPSDQPIFRTGINTVRVDVIVTDRQGNPVSRSQARRFRDPGRRQAAEGRDVPAGRRSTPTTQPAYTQRALRTRNDEETAAADENSRIFAFFLDDYHVMRDSSMSLKKPVIDFIANQLAPSDLATVMYPLTPVDAAVLTRNHQGIINCGREIRGPQVQLRADQRRRDRLRLQADAGRDRDHPPAGDAVARFAACAPSSARCARAASR